MIILIFLAYTSQEIIGIILGFYPFQEYDGEKYGKTLELAYSIDTKLSKTTEFSAIVGISKEVESFLGSKGFGAYNLDESETYTKYIGANYIKISQTILTSKFTV